MQADVIENFQDLIQEGRKYVELVDTTEEDDQHIAEHVEQL